MTGQFDDEVRLRAWGTPDRREAEALAAENAPRSRDRPGGRPTSAQRQRAVEQRARDANWPLGTRELTQHAQRKAQRRALARLEPAWSYERQVHSDWPRRRTTPGQQAWLHGDRDDGDGAEPATIFDE